MTKQRPLPLRQGNQIQFYTYALLPANLNQAAEGTVGSPISESSTKIVATIGQYADFINSSDLAMDVNLAPIKYAAISVKLCASRQYRGKTRKGTRRGHTLHSKIWSELYGDVQR